MGLLRWSAKRGLAGLLAGLLAGSLPCVALGAGAAGVAPQALRVVADNNYPPYLFLNASGKPEGYLVDLWALWQKKTGVPVELRPMQWAAAQQAMHDGQADVIDMMFRTPVREQLYDFSDPYATLAVSIYVDSAIAGIHDIASINGFMVGVQSGDACIDQLSARGIVNLRAYPDYMAILEAARAGDIRMFCMDDGPADYYLYLQRQQQRVSKAFTLYSGQFHYAVSKGDSATLALVKRGMARISEDEREALRKKWFAQPLQLRPYLRILSIGAAAVLALLAVALLWIRSLRRAVRHRTGEIQRKNEQLVRAASALATEQAQLRLLFESSPDAMALKDKNHVYLHCNAGVEALLGLPRERIIGKTDRELFADQALLAQVRQQDHEVLRSGRPHRDEETLVAADGSERTLEVIKVPIRAADGEVSGVLAVARDITERRRAERELRIAAVAFESQDGMMITDANGRIERVNAAFTRISGFAATEAVGRTPGFLQSGLHDRVFYDALWQALTSVGYWSGEVANRRKDGSLYSARLSITVVCDAQGDAVHYVGSLQDISGEKQALALAEKLKRFDPLTDLANRDNVMEQLQRAIRTSGECHEFGAIMMIDLDHFQRVNDSLGHAAGDQLLLEMARRLQAILRERDTLARFSGDSFVMLCEHLGPDMHASASRAFGIADAARKVLAEHMLLEGRRIPCSASIGVTLFRGAQTGADTLMQRVDLAMYKSKEAGRDTVRFFEENMQSDLDERNWIEAALREAISHEQLVLYYQVQVDGAGSPTGAEALLRWRHPERGTISPCSFIPLAEESGLIVSIGQWALRAACRQLARWQSMDNLRDLSLAVNISPRQFKSDSFVAHIMDEVRRSGAPIGKLKLEVTESLAIDDFKSSIARLNVLRDAGFSISLDDFGTGNSSLNYLTKLPLTQLKIDKSFVDELPSSQRDGMVAQTIIAMGKGLGLDVIAEGVETQAQRDYLVAHGCQAFQGYLFGKPLPLAEFEALCQELLLAAEVK